MPENTPEATAELSNYDRFIEEYKEGIDYDYSGEFVHWGQLNGHDPLRVGIFGREPNDIFDRRINTMGDLAFVYLNDPGSLKLDGKGESVLRELLGTRSLIPDLDSKP